MLPSPLTTIYKVAPLWDHQTDNDIAFTDNTLVPNQNKDYSTAATNSTVPPLFMAICTQNFLNHDKKCIGYQTSSFPQTQKCNQHCL